MNNELIILVSYINVQGQSMSTRQQILWEFNKYLENTFNDTDKNIKLITIPVDDGQPTKIECIYPKGDFMKDNGTIIDIYEEILKQQYDEISLSNLNLVIRKLKIKKLLKRSS